MADFRTAILKTLVHEGGYVNLSTDPGGETYRGVSRKNWPNWTGWPVIDGYKSNPSFPKILDSDTNLLNLIIEFYREGFWKDLWSQIRSQLIADKLFDLGVLFGVHTSVAILQTTLNTTADGLFGQATLEAVNQVDEAAFLTSYKANLVTHTFNLAAANPSLREFLRGWATRINS
jgi:lysozyme family protein